ncbi:MAG TPA: HDOD domain-containing protein [Thermodesulfobacteriota bacterium]|nr:HDOD domain-containing protein [Thermodesulfobacteriota bacterium]
MTASDVKAYINDLECLPTIPVVGQKITALSNKEDAAANELADLIGHDPALAALVIRGANLKTLGHPGQVRDIRQAILFLGVERIMTMSSCMNCLINAPATHATSDLKNLWIHFYDVALIASILSEYVSITSSDECFLSGLLHDMGRIIFYKMDLDRFNQIITTDDMLEQEEAIFGCTHAEAGAWFAEKSGLPPEIVTAARYHHHPALSREFKDVISIVSLAEALSRTFCPRIEDDGIWSNEHDAILLELGLDDFELDSIRGKLALAREGINGFFSKDTSRILRQTRAAFPGKANPLPS